LEIFYDNYDDDVSLTTNEKRGVMVRNSDYRVCRWRNLLHTRHNFVTSRLQNEKKTSGQNSTRQ